MEEWIYLGQGYQAFIDAKKVVDESVKLTFSELFVANLRAASMIFFEPKSSCEAGNA